NPSLYFINVEVETKFGTVMFNKKTYETENKNLVQINEVADVIRGVNLRGRKQMEASEGEEYPVIQIRDVEEWNIQFANISEFPIQSRNIKRVTATPGDILVASRGTQQKIAIVPEYKGKVLVSNMFIIIRLKGDQSINPFYIKRFLESPV